MEHEAAAEFGCRWQQLAIKRLCLGLCGRKAEQVIRLLFKLCVILCLIFIGLSYFMPARAPQPGGSENESASSAGILAGAAAFGAFIADIDGFCARNPQSCETGKSLFGTLADRASQGAAVAYKWFGATLQKGAENTDRHLAAEKARNKAENAAAPADVADKAADSAAAKPMAEAKNAEAAKPAPTPAAASAPAARPAAKAVNPAPAARAAHREKAAKALPRPQAAPAAKSKAAKAAAEPIPGARPRYKAKNMAE